MKNNKKSPLTDKPLRNPGQSLDEEINSLINDNAMTYIIGYTENISNETFIKGSLCV